MPLIDLKTNLKDLKFGHDQYNGVSSNQPFVVTSLPPTEDPLPTDYLPKDIINSLANSAISSITGGKLGDISQSNVSGPFIVDPVSGTGGKDFLVRGGFLIPTTISKDSIRISRFLNSQDGLFFTLKQQILSRISVRPEYAGEGIIGKLLNDGVYNPLSTVLGAVGAPFGLHPNKQGLNPLAGIFKDYTPDRYYSYITRDNREIFNSIATNKEELSRNRLYSLYSVKLIKGNTNKYTRRNDVSKSPDFLISYQGGPGSVLGIGRTRIKYATDQFDSKLTIIGDNVNGWTLQQIAELSDTTHLFNSKHTDTAILYNYGKPKELRIGSGDPGNPKLKYATWANFTNGYLGTSSFGAASPFSYDRITSLPIYRTSNESKDPNQISDLVNFRIGVIDNTTNNIDNIHFRAFLNSITDSYEASWNSVKYIGRGENFYTYSGFDRKVSFSWTVAAQSKIELIPMYKKLNYLASLTAPDYGSFGYMRANIIHLTIGGYFFNQPGLINRISYEISEDTTWEIGIADSLSGESKDTSVKQLPHMIKVSFEFTPIHNFVPRKQNNTYGNDNDPIGLVAEYGKEHFIALQDSNDSNWQVDSQDKKLFEESGLPIPQTPSPDVSQPEKDNNENSKVKKNSKLRKWWQDIKTVNAEANQRSRQFENANNLNDPNGSRASFTSFINGIGQGINDFNDGYLTPGDILGNPNTETDDPYQGSFDEQESGE